jgi:hypothetical protein
MTDATKPETFDAPERPGATETEFERAPCALFDHESVVTADSSMVMIRLKGNRRGGTAVYVGYSPARAMRIGAAFQRAARSLDPSLSIEAVDGDLKQAKEKHLKPVGGDE